MSQLYAGWGVPSLLACLIERTEGIAALCHVLLDRDDASDDARELAEGVLDELEGGNEK
ncbi:hypothetical protein ACTQZK_06435 [Paraeggerthella sp. LCP19S3_G8]|uniref:hypothetical protein n=1 Tax=Paraeggerthella sp. LCP19S3_G8 TaxID=3440248 RepID=UPI002A8CDDC0|nr:hypothetical protein [Paraeggerthella sp.]